MSALVALARAQAMVSGRAQPIATVRHIYLDERPIVLIPLMLAGEANAPLAMLIGDEPDRPQLLIVPQPRNWDQRFEFVGELADLLLSYLEQPTQLLVPNTGGVRFLQLLGRSIRFREGAAGLLGRWLTFYGEQAQIPGSCLLLAATEVLSRHWATGQSALEDNNLAALLGWIADGPQAARAAEDPELWPPAGPATDPAFDNDVLAPAISAGDISALEKVLFGQMEPTWRLLWQAVKLLRELPEGASVPDRWAGDSAAFTSFAEYVPEGLPQPRRDGAVAAARRLDRMERAQARYDAQRAFDDPLVMAEQRLTGEAFNAVVTYASPDRIDDSGTRRKLRPRIMVHTTDPVRLSEGTKVASPARRGQEAVIIRVTTVDDGTELVLELVSGMGRSLTPAPGTVPEVDDVVCYSAQTPGYRQEARFPDVEATPWTHGGPPA